MEKRSDLHLLTKEVGETPNETILRFKKDNTEYEDVTMTYAGRLDPMAEGLLLVLSGENLKVKEKFLGLPKTYEFEILWGFETDTLDLLGLVADQRENSLSTFPSKDTDIFLLKNSSSSLRRASLVPSREMISTNFPLGKFIQKYPAYSSKPVSGKPLFKWAREGRLSQIEIPTHEVEIFESEFISKVSGDFRQEEISAKWQEFFAKTTANNFVIDKIIVEVSSGFYVRQFVSDLAEKLKVSGVTFSIKRTKVGDYNLVANF